MRSSLGGTSTCAVEPAAASFSPSANDAADHGDREVHVALGRADDETEPVVPRDVVARSKITTASAPAACAFAALMANPQLPRWMSAMSSGPAKAAASKSAASQPLVLARGGASARSTGMTLPVTSPEPEPVNVPVS